MSLSRSPSPQRGGGWSSPGLTTPYDNHNARATPKASFERMNGAPKNATWATAQARSAEVNGYPTYSTRKQGFFGRHFRRLSSSLPRFNQTRDYAEKEKLGRGRYPPGSRTARLWNLATRIARIFWRLRLRVGLLIGALFCVTLFYTTPLHRVYRRTIAGGSRFVVILAANEGGGVMEWKGPREWAIERDSVKNKKKYVKRWGYKLEIVDMGTKKRYAHEWRESWEKVDNVRKAMKKYPNAEWFWWLDLNTFIMEPSYSLQNHIFFDLSRTTYRDINIYNPLNISHPFTAPYLDPISLSPVGDNLPSSIYLIVPQDCDGFNLGSFFVRRSAWTDRLLDVWWDPVAYEQRHMQWEHKEQDALEYLYTNQPWIRPHTAFIRQRAVNSFPPGACGDAKEDEGEHGAHYSEKERDFLVNMAGCEWGRDCWGEMYHYRELSNRLNRMWWERFRDGIGEWFKSLRDSEKKVEEAKEKGKDGAMEGGKNEESEKGS